MAATQSGLSIQRFFDTFARKAAGLVGSPGAFLLAVLFIVGWSVSGPFFGFSERWQLVVNTGTTIVTFLLVFHIQNTQNRDDKAVHDKLDELIRTLEGADKRMIAKEEKGA